MSRAEKRWHARLAVLLAVVALIASQVPRVVYGSSGCDGETLGSAAVASLSDRTEVLVLGSSHVLFGIRPQQYSMPLVSLAATWLDYSAMQRVLEKHLPRVPNLKVAVIEYDELPLVSDLVPAMLASRDLRPLRELSLSAFEIPTATIGQRLQTLWTEWISPMRNLPRITLLEWRERGKACSPLYHPPVGFAAGYYYTDGVTPADFDAQAVFDALSGAARREEVVQRNLAALGEMTATLQRRGVKVVLLRLPHTAEYWAGVPGTVTARWRQLQDWARGNPGLSVLDWGKRAEFLPGDFVDIHHLNVFGADRLARLLDAQLSALLETR
jgi:hypothetical protein